MKSAWGLCALLGLALAATTSPAAAHHSFSMFDQTKDVTLKGVVKEFQWTNPHAWLQVKIVNTAGADEEWGVEMISPSVLARTGWKRNSLKPGDEVTVTINPVRNGTHFGSLVRVVDKAGQPIGIPRQ